MIINHDTRSDRFEPTLSAANFSFTGGATVSTSAYDRLEPTLPGQTSLPACSAKLLPQGQRLLNYFGNKIDRRAQFKFHIFYGLQPGCLYQDQQFLS